jgi:mRNA interferase MazF
MNQPKRADIWQVDLGEPRGSNPADVRPCVVVQTDAINRSSWRTTIVVPLTTNLRRGRLPGCVLLPADAGTGLSMASVAVTQHVLVADKDWLIEHVGVVCVEHLAEIDAALAYSLDLSEDAINGAATLSRRGV